MLNRRSDEEFNARYRRAHLMTGSGPLSWVSIVGESTTNKHPDLWAYVRLYVLRRDGRRCVLCGRGEDDILVSEGRPNRWGGIGRLEVDHIVAVSLGGDRWDPANIQTLCTPCHKKKTTDDNRAGAIWRKLAGLKNEGYDGSREDTQTKSAVRSYTCPHCSADFGQPCTWSSGNAVGVTKKPHGERMALARRGRFER